MLTLKRYWGAGPPFHCQRTHRGCPTVRAFRRVGMRTPNARRSPQYQFNIGSCRAPHPSRRAEDGIHQRKGEDSPTSADISATRGPVAFALIQAMVLGSSRDAETSLSPALSCPYGLRYVYYCTYNIASTKCSTWNTGTPRQSWYGRLTGRMLNADC